MLTAMTHRVSLTAREMDVVKLIAEDLTGKEISHRLGIAQSTVDFHRHEIMTRLGVRGIAGIVRYAIREGIIAP